MSLPAPKTIRNALHSALLGAAAATLGACAGLAGIPNAADAHAASAGKPVYLRAMKTQLAAPRAAIGPLYAGPNCAQRGEVIWDDGLFRQVSHQLPKIFRRSVQRAHYRVPPDAGPETTGLHGAPPEYMEVDMQVQELSAGLCTQDEGSSGSVHMKVFWQVYAAGNSTPLYETSTQGSYQAPILEKRAQADFFALAFSAALDDLLAQPGFRQAVTRSTSP